MQTTTPEMPEAPPREVTGLSSLALGAATRALRITAVVVLLTGIVAGGAGVRFHRASEPSPPNSADERAYLTLAPALPATGRYGNPGMNAPLHWPPATPALF